MLKTKPIIGLAGGIGSGKSTVARLMGSLGGRVIDADVIAKASLDLPEVRGRLVEWWGQGVLDAGGKVDRRKVADRIFARPEERRRLEAVVHPIVQRERAVLLERAMADAAVRFAVQDVPLLYEVGLEKECDFVVFVRADRRVRLERVKKARGWDEAELNRREKNQMDPDRKMNAAHAIIENNGDEAHCLVQVCSALGRLLP